MFDEFRRYNQGRIREQWQVLLDGRERLPGPFKRYGRVAPPRFYSGSLKHRSDLAGAVEDARTAGGGPRLLVVGPAGYGKTVALLDIAQHLAEQHGDSFGAPVVFNLGSWRHDDDDLGEWMVRVLCDPTGPLPGAADVVIGWVAEGRVAPMLDGLDEILDDSLRRGCVAAINAFIHRAEARTALVVASRPAEYTAISNPRAACLAVNAAIELEPLRPELVTARLRETSPDAVAVSGLADLVEAPTHPVAELLRVPLWLWMATTVDDSTAASLRDQVSVDDAQAVLADAFISRAVVSVDIRTGLGPAACRRYLAAIAGFLADPISPDAVTFRFEDLIPTQLRRTTAAATGLILGMVGGLAGALAGAAVLGLTREPSGGLAGALVGGLVLGLAVGLVCGLLGGLHDIQPASPRFRWPGGHRLVDDLTEGLAVGLASGLVVGLVGGLAVGLIDGLTYGLTYGLIGGLTYGLIGGLDDDNDVVAETIDEGRAASRTSWAIDATAVGLVVGLASGIAAGLASGIAVGLVLGIAVGLFGVPGVGLAHGLNRGGWYLLLQRQIRKRAQRQSLLPDDPVGFVRAVIAVGALRQTGSGVQFRHRSVADRLAIEAPTPGLAHLRKELQAGPSALN